MKSKHIGLIVALAIVGVMAADTFSKSGTMDYAPPPTQNAVAQNTTSSPNLKTSSSVSTTKVSNVTLYTMADVELHSSQSSCWTTISGKVYNLTSWISKHPGGPEAILSICGKDGTSAFESQHGGNARANAELAAFFIGNLSQ